MATSMIPGSPPLLRSGCSVLLVQNSEPALRALARFLDAHFGSVAMARSPSEAEAMLDALRPDYVICGQRFGPDEPSGCAWVAGWRARRPFVRAVVLSTAEEPPPEPKGIDAIFVKPLDPMLLIRWLVGLEVKAS